MGDVPYKGRPCFRIALVWALLLSLGYAGFCQMEPKPPAMPAEMSRTLGVRLFYRFECGRCHALHSLPGAEGKIGPPLDHVGSVAATRRPGVTGHDYLMESLVDPQAFVVEGYLRVMPSFAHLSAGELNELVVYLEAQK